MAFPAHSFDGILRPEEFFTVRNVYARIVSEPWVTKDLIVQAQFARYVLRMYSRGMRDPERLFRLCLIAAKYKLVEPAIIDLPGQTTPVR